MKPYILLLILGITTSTFAQQNVYHDNVVVVVDASGSMDRYMGNTNLIKMDVAKQALKTVLQNIPNTTHIGIVVFGRVNQPWVYQLGPQDQQAIDQAIDSIQASGGTPLGEYIKKGADALLNKREQQFGYGSYRLLVVTDGEAGDQRLVDEYVPDVVARGITLDVIGVDMDGTHSLAKRAHSYRKGNDPASLKQAIQQVFAEVGSSTDDKLTSDFELLEPLDDQMASVMIQALSQTGNQPIGETTGTVPIQINGVAVPTITTPPTSSGINSGVLVGIITTVGLIVIVAIWKS